MSILRFYVVNLMRVIAIFIIKEAQLRKILDIIMWKRIYVMVSFVEIQLYVH